MDSQGTLKEPQIYFFRRCILIATLLSWVIASATAQSESEYHYYGGVVSSITRQGIYPAHVELLTPDSAVVDTFCTQTRYNIYGYDGGWMLKVSRKNEPMIIRISAKGFETKYLNVGATSFNGRVRSKKFGEVALKPLPREVALKGATVKATRIKFYNKGDTLVYNADAFKLAEGSMLDALIRQLPGARLTDDGEIFVNGRKIENLLLNGEDFFEGKNNIMLDNLPAYMVKDIKVFEKRSRMEEYFDIKTGPGVYSMSVNLKKQYSVGWIGNAEAGAGTDDRYLARLFALRFTPQSRIALFGTANNVNETRKPGQNGDWMPQKQNGSLLATKKGGLDYSVKDRRKKWNINGNVEVTHSSNDSQSRTATQNFLESGDTYSKSYNRSTSSNTQLDTRHDIWITPDEKWYVSLTPSLNYNRNRNKGFAAGGTFDTDPDKAFGKALLDSMQGPMSGTIARQIALNRSMSRSRSNGNDYKLGTSWNASFRATDIDFLTMGGEFSLKRAESFYYGHDTQDFFRTDGSTYKNQYTRNKPQNDFGIVQSLGYTMFLKNNIQWQNSYTFRYKRTHTAKGRYRLDRLPGWGRDDTVKIGDLPSAQEYKQAIDAGNSYDRIDNNYQNSFTTGYYREYGRNNNSEWNTMGFSFTFMRIRQALDYRRAEINARPRRNYFYVYPNLYVRHTWDNWQHAIQARYDVNINPPDMVTQISYTDDNDLFNVYKGGSKLKKSIRHEVYLNYTENLRKSGKSLNGTAQLSLTQNSEAWGYVYDKTSGVRTWTPCNVNGNYYVFGSVQYNTPIDKKRKFTFYTHTSSTFYHNVDMIGEENNTAPLRSTVKTLSVHQELGTGYNFARGSVGIKGAVIWNNATSSRKNFTTLNACDFNYGATLTCTLPANIQLATDLTVYSRRGYDSREMNTDDIVWNGSLSRSFFKNAITLKFTGFDILGQLSNVSRYVNAQGRYETWRNSITRYGMVSVIYRLNVKPKKLQSGTN